MYIITELLRKLFLVREIKSQEDVLHFQRWRLIQTPWFAIYIHRIFKYDEDKHCHDHPWSFISFVLSGGYAWTNNHVETWFPVLRTGDVTYNKSTDVHKIVSLLKIPTTTLVFTGPRNREWGYDVDGEWVHHKEYRLRKQTGEWDKR